MDLYPPNGLGHRNPPQSRGGRVGKGGCGEEGAFGGGRDTSEPRSHPYTVEDDLSEEDIGEEAAGVRQSHQKFPAGCVAHRTSSRLFCGGRSLGRCGVCE